MSDERPGCVRGRTCERLGELTRRVLGKAIYTAIVVRSMTTDGHDRKRVKIVSDTRDGGKHGTTDRAELDVVRQDVIDVIDRSGRERNEVIDYLVQFYMHMEELSQKIFGTPGEYPTSLLRELKD